MKRRRKGRGMKSTVVEEKETSEAQHNCSPPADWCPASPWATIHNPGATHPPPPFYTDHEIHGTAYPFS